jgi:hypothetical protein
MYPHKQGKGWKRNREQGNKGREGKKAKERKKEGKKKMFCETAYSICMYRHMGMYVCCRVGVQYATQASSLS